jgi:aryl-alcohol dehydrogenase-like predicted oxidoreductase
VRFCAQGPRGDVGHLPGRATEVGTRRFRDRSIRDRALPSSHFRTAPGGLTVTSIGLGTYIGPPDGPTDLAVEQATTVCLTSGRVNVLDTAINYRYQRAERSLGRALARLVENGSVARDEVFVATKNGYLAPDGEAKVPAEKWVERELVRPGILDPKDLVEGSHAMSVSFLTDQFARSRANLGVETIDLLYLHNAADAQLAAVGREEFLRRLESAFRLYERFREDGSLGWYGLATWDCLRTRPDDPGYLALDDALELAVRAGGRDHGFRFLQFPFNVAMPEAATFRNQAGPSGPTTLFDAAAGRKFGCFTSVPLFQGQLARSGPKRPGLSAAQTALQFSRSAPGTLGPLVGQKQLEHLSENLEIATFPPWDEASFRSLGA